MNDDQSDYYYAIRDGMLTYQMFTSRTAKYQGSPLISGARWLPPGQDKVLNSPSTVPADKIVRLGYLIGKLNGEAGEASEHFWKFMRDSTEAVVVEDDSLDGWKLDISDELVGKLMKECGDVLWYVSQICDALGENLGDCAVANLEKLRSRAERGVLGGSGDDR